MKYTKREVVEATAAWLGANPDQAVVVVDDHNVSWAVPKAAYEAVQLAAAIQDARAALAKGRT
jgi:hypothetical protein